MCWGYGTYADIALRTLGRQCPCGKAPGHRTRELISKQNPPKDSVEEWWENPR